MTNEQDRPEPTPDEGDTAPLWERPEAHAYPPPEPEDATEPQHATEPDPEPEPWSQTQPLGEPFYAQQPYQQAYGQPYQQYEQPYPPYEQQYQQPYQSTYQQTAYPYAPRPLGPGGPDGPPQKARVPGWLWPVVAATALVVGTIGGAIGGAIVADEGTGDGGIFDTVDPSDDSDGATSTAPLPADNGSIAVVAARLLPSTVQVNARGGSGTGQGATGSGFVVDSKGHVITNNHVVESATGDGELKVVDHEGRSYDATIVGRSPVYDIAVLEVEDAGALKPAAIGSSRSMRIGEGVVAIGSPLGLSSTVTSGIVSALDRPVTTGSGDDSSYINAVQTDAAINPGNSGGPLVNLRGQVVGVNSAIATTGGFSESEGGNIGVGFAIPMEQVQITARQILRTGEAQYPVIGAEVNTVPEKTGANIVKVNADAPAQQAGLKAGDLVVAVDKKRVQDSIGLIVAIRSHQPGETITLTVLRSGDEQTVRIKLGAQSDTPSE